MSITPLPPATEEHLAQFLAGFDDPYLLFTLHADGEFLEGQSYDDHAAFSLGCERCGSKTFRVGVCSHLTLIKCVACDKIIYTHDG